MPIGIHYTHKNPLVSSYTAYALKIYIHIAYANLLCAIGTRYARENTDWSIGQQYLALTAADGENSSRIAVIKTLFYNYI